MSGAFLVDRSRRLSLLGGGGGPLSVWGVAGGGTGLSSCFFCLSDSRKFSASSKTIDGFEAVLPEDLGSEGGVE